MPARRVSVELIDRKPRASAERYEFLQEIARGGTGIVHRARDREGGRDVALKVLHRGHMSDRGAVMRFAEEAQIAGQLLHPGVPPILDVGCLADGTPYYAMKLVEGRTLSEILAQRISAHERRAYFLNCFAKICQTVAFAHSRGVIHCDLRPAIVVVGAFGEVQILDWGLALMLSKAPPQGEVIRLRDERVDVFGLGVVLCEIMTGGPPLTRQSVLEAAEHATPGDLAPALARVERSGFDREIVHLARRCLAADPAERPQDAGAVAEEVAGYLAALEERARASQLAAAAAQELVEEEQDSKRRGIAITAAVLLGVFAIAGGILWMRIDAQSRLDRASASVRSALDDAERERVEARNASPEDISAWVRAAEAVKRARDILAGVPVDDDLKSRAEMLQQDIEEERSAAAAAAARFERNRKIRADLAALEVHQAGSFGWALEPPAYAAVLRSHDIDIDASVEAAAAEIQASGVAPEVARALDRLAYGERWSHPERVNGWRRWLELSRRCDADPLRNRIRQAVLDDSLEALESAAAAPELAAAGQDTRHLLDASLLVLLVGRSTLASSVARLQRLSHQLLEAPRSSEAWEQAADLFDADDPLESIAALRQAVALRPEAAELQGRLGRRLADMGFAAEAVAALQTATRLAPADAPHWCALAEAQHARGEHDGALASARKAAAAAPDDWRCALLLGRLLKEGGRCDEAGPYLARGIELAGAAAEPVSPQALRWPEECREQAELAGLTDAYYQGLLKPSDNEQRLQLAQIFQHQKRMATSARFFTDAFDRDPGRVTTDYLAASRAAAQAGIGGGTDAASMGPDERAGMLRQALIWLRAGVEAASERQGGAESKQRFHRELRLLQRDVLLAPLQDPSRLGLLDAEEQEVVAVFWRAVASLLRSP